MGKKSAKTNDSSGENQIPRYLAFHLQALRLAMETEDALAEMLALAELRKYLVKI